MIELTPREKLGWLLFWAGSLLAWDVAFTTGGALGLKGAISTTLLAAAAVLGVSAARQTGGGSPRA